MRGAITTEMAAPNPRARVLRLGHMLFSGMHIVLPPPEDDAVSRWYHALHTDASTEWPAGTLTPVEMFRFIWPFFPAFRAYIAANDGLMLQMLLSNVRRLRVFARAATSDMAWDITKHAAQLVEALDGVDSLAVADGICDLDDHALRVAIQKVIAERTAWPSDAVLRVIHHLKFADDRSATVGLPDLELAKVRASNSADLAYFLAHMQPVTEHGETMRAKAIAVSKKGFTDVGAALFGLIQHPLHLDPSRVSTADIVHLAVCDHTGDYTVDVKALARKWYRNEAGRSTEQAHARLLAMISQQDFMGTFETYAALAKARGGVIAEEAQKIVVAVRKLHHSAQSFGRVGAFLYTE